MNRFFSLLLGRKLLNNKGFYNEDFGVEDDI